MSCVLGPGSDGLHRVSAVSSLSGTGALHGHPDLEEPAATGLADARSLGAFLGLAALVTVLVLDVSVLSELKAARVDALDPF